MGSFLSFYNFDEENKRTFKFYNHLPPSFIEFRAHLVFRMYQLSTWDNRPIKEIPEDKRWGKLFSDLLERSNFYLKNETSYLAHKPSFCWHRINKLVDEIHDVYDTRLYSSIETSPFIHSYYHMKQEIHPHCKYVFLEAIDSEESVSMRGTCKSSDCPFNIGRYCDFVKRKSNIELMEIMKEKLDGEKEVLEETKSDIKRVIDWLRIHSS